MTKINTTIVRGEGGVAPANENPFDIDLREVRAERFSGVGGNEGEAGTTIVTTITISIIKHVSIAIKVC